VLKKNDILMSNKQLLRISRTCKQKFHEKIFPITLVKNIGGLLKNDEYSD